MAKIMPWVRRREGKWLETPVNVEEVRWDELNVGDVVFIAGNLDFNGVPTKVYGRHTVVKPEKRILENATGKPFFEGFDYVFREV